MQWTAQSFMSTRLTFFNGSHMHASECCGGLTVWGKPLPDASRCTYHVKTSKLQSCDRLCPTWKSHRSFSRTRNGLSHLFRNGAPASAIIAAEHVQPLSRTGPGYNMLIPSSRHRAARCDRQPGVALRGFNSLCATRKMPYSTGNLS